MKIRISVVGVQAEIRNCHLLNKIQRVGNFSPLEQMKPSALNDLGSCILLPAVCSVEGVTKVCKVEVEIPKERDSLEKMCS